MIDGYYAFLSGWIAIVLLWMGAFPSLPAKLGVKRKTLVYFLLISWIGVWVVVPATSQLSLNIGGFFVPVAATVVLWAREDEWNRIYLFAAGALMGSSIYLIHRMLLADPVFMVIDETFFLAILCTSFSLIIVHRFVHHFVVITLGLVAEQLLFANFLSQRVPVVELGDGFFRNIWWLSLLTAFIFQAVLDTFKNWPLFRRGRLENENPRIK